MKFFLKYANYLCNIVIEVEKFDHKNRALLGNILGGLQGYKLDYTDSKFRYYTDSIFDITQKVDNRVWASPAPSQAMKV